MTSPWAWLSRGPAALALALLLFLLPSGCSAGALTIGGQPVERIYVDAGATGESPVQVAADELNHHLGKVIGHELAVVHTDDPATVRGPAIVVGALAVRMGAVPGKTSASREGFRLLTRGDLLLIGGESDAGALFGAYALLEKLGFDWVMPGPIGEISPPAKTLAAPTLDESQAPDFAMRRLWYRGGRKLVSADEQAEMDVWLRRQKGGSYQPVAAETAGHYWPTFIKKHKAAFDQDPTLYALRRNPDGTVSRRGPQLEAADPRIARMMADDIRDAFAKKGWPRDKTVGFPIGPADAGGFSISPMAVAAGLGPVDPVTGEADQTDLIVRLGNAVLKDLGPAYPHVYLGFYSYGPAGGYPVRYRPDPRIAVIFAPINFSRYHALVDPRSRTQAAYKAVFDKWAALHRAQGNPLLYRGYNWNLAENMLPYTKARIWGEELPYYRDAGVSGLNIEATKAWGVNGPSDWILMKLAWNASQDWRALLADYCRKAFGDGGPAMERYFLRLADRQRDAGQEAGSYHAIALIYDHAFVQAARADMAEATRLAKTADQRTRISYFAPSVELLDEYLDYKEAADRFDFARALDRYDAMRATWAKAHALNPDIAAKEAPQYLERFIGGFVTQAAAYSSGEHRIVQPLPDALETAFGPITDAPPGEGWRATRTYGSTWDAQRLSAGADQAVWYRYRFAAPPDRPLYLFLGGFNDEATVFVNGRRLASSGRRFSQPAVFDVTSALGAGQNVLLIRIVRNQSLNEIGVGGLFRPAFLFTGPRPAEAVN
jgi:hypothetical protein